MTKEKVNNPALVGKQKSNRVEQSRAEHKRRRTTWTEHQTATERSMKQQQYE
jgi:hypothetical protein